MHGESKMRSQGHIFQAKICQTNMSSKSDRIQFCVFHDNAIKSIIYLYDDQQMHMYKYVQSYIIIILHQHVPVTLVTIIRVLYYNQCKKADVGIFYENIISVFPK
jgi:hypothetical protein